jgi:REP element-mobilizing transposase RayT
MRAIRAALAIAKERFGLRIVEYSVQGNHLHMLIEAKGSAELARGMRGLTIRIARRVNGAVGRSGRVFAERYHARALGSPREVQRCLRYVLLNHRRHAAQTSLRLLDLPFDRCSSAPAFDGWKPGSPSPPDRWRDEAAATVVAPRTWLLAKGWRRHGLLRPDDLPG